MTGTATGEGLHQKYRVERVDGRDQAGGDKENARYFVLDYVNDPLARWPLLDYANRAWRQGYESLAEDLWAALRAVGMEFETPPEEKVRTDALVAGVEARMVEVYGEDRDRWPRPDKYEGR